MKILYFYPEKNVIMNKWQRYHFIDELRRHNISIDIFNPLTFSCIEEANESVCQQAMKGGYNLFFTNFCNKEMVFPETLARMHEMGLPTLSYRGDNLVMPYNDKYLAKYFDLVWLTAKETQHLYDKWGAKTVFAPYAANPFVYKYDENISLERSICFIGRPYGSRSIMLNSLAEASVHTEVFFGNVSIPEDLLTEEIKFDILGITGHKMILNRLRFPEGRRLIKGSIINRIKGQTTLKESSFISKNPGVLPDAISALYSKYVLSVASTSAGHTDVLKNPLKIINLRNFEIPMSGGIEICKYNQELAGYYEEDKEIVFYRSNEEFIDKAKYYTQKASDSEIVAIRRSARTRSVNEHTWFHRFKKCFDELGLKY